MSSASAGGNADNSGEKNFAVSPDTAQPVAPSTTSTVAAEAQQGDGPAAASASASAVTENMARTSAVSTCIGPDYAAAACEFGAVAVGPYSAAAASQVGVAVVGPQGAAATSNSANSSEVQVFEPHRRDPQAPDDSEPAGTSGGSIGNGKRRQSTDGS